MNTQRTDTHKPSLLDPSEYTFVSAFYQGSSTAMMKCYDEEMAECYYPAVESEPVFNGNHANKCTCDHCGAAFAHGVLFRHVPTGELIHVGHICASNTVGLPSRAAALRKRAEQAQAEENERQKRHEAATQWASENTDVVEFLAKYSVEVKDAGRRSHPFLDDMVRSLYKWGTLFPNQANAVRKFIANENKPKPAPEPEPTTPLIEGRREITGTVVSTKWQNSMYGETLKMLVREADGNKVWGTVPSSITDAGYLVMSSQDDALKGKTVTFTAKVERSADDEHFGFFSRPTKASVIETEEVK